MLYIENYFPDWSLIIAFYVFLMPKGFFHTVLVYIFNFSERNMATREYERNKILFNIFLGDLGHGGAFLSSPADELIVDVRKVLNESDLITL